jgi:hypothetical protein
MYEGPHRLCQKPAARTDTLGVGPADRTGKTSPHAARRNPGSIGVSAPAVVKTGGDQRYSFKRRSDEGGGAAALHGVRRSRRRPFR